MQFECFSTQYLLCTTDSAAVLSTSKPYTNRVHQSDLSLPSQLKMTTPELVKTPYDETDKIIDVEQFITKDEQKTKRLPEELDGITDSMHIMFLRIFGALALLFSIIEFILGGAAWNFLNNSKVGSWWAGIIAIIAGYLGVAYTTRRRVIATCVISFLAVIVAAVGAAYDGMNFMTINLLTAASSMDPSFGAITNYGSSTDWDRADKCLVQANPIVYNSCYCVGSREDNICSRYSLTTYSTSVYMNCGNIFTTYNSLLIASTAFCVLILISTLALFIVTTIVLCCPGKSYAIGVPPVTPKVEEEVEVGVNGSANGHENAF